MVWLADCRIDAASNQGTDKSSSRGLKVQARGGADEALNLHAAVCVARQRLSGCFQINDKRLLIVADGSLTTCRPRPL
jgi:hypothetical protein